MLGFNLEKNIYNQTQMEKTSKDSENKLTLKDFIISVLVPLISATISAIFSAGDKDGSTF